MIRVPPAEGGRAPERKKKPKPSKRNGNTSPDDFGDDPYAASPSGSLPPRTKKKKKSKSHQKSSTGKFSGAKKFQLGVSMFFGSMLFSAGRIAVFGNKTPITNEEKGAAFGAALVIFVGVVAGLVLMLWGSIQKRRERQD